MQLNLILSCITYCSVSVVIRALYDGNMHLPNLAQYKTLYQILEEQKALINHFDKAGDLPYFIDLDQFCLPWKEVNPGYTVIDIPRSAFADGKDF